jgi:hypothetical protein
MNSRRQILIAHYQNVAKKAASWAGLLALLGTMFVAGPASALGNQMGARSVTPTTLKAGSTNTYNLSFTPGTSGTVGSLQFQLCDSPLESVACANSTTAGTNSYGDSFATSVITVSGTGWTGGTWTTGIVTGPAGGGGTGVSAKIANGGTTNTPTNAQPATVAITNVVNPTGNNQKYYLRVTTYSAINYTGEVDYGAMALQTAQDIVVSAQVQESLEFCTGDNTLVATCSTVGSGAISLGTGSNCPILSTANVCTGLSKMAASTNAQAGYSITYNGTNLTSGADTITANGSPGAASTPNTRQFGLAITAQTGSGTKAATYDFSGNGSKYVYLVTTPTQIATGTAANGEAIYTVTYAANVDATVKAGAYTATINYVCTGNF